MAINNFIGFWLPFFHHHHQISFGKGVYVCNGKTTYIRLIHTFGEYRKKVDRVEEKNTQEKEGGRTK